MNAAIIVGRLPGWHNSPQQQQPHTALTSSGRGQCGDQTGSKTYVKGDRSPRIGRQEAKSTHDHFVPLQAKVVAKSQETECDNGLPRNLITIHGRTDHDH